MGEETGFLFCFVLFNSTADTAAQITYLYQYFPTSLACS